MQRITVTQINAGFEVKLKILLDPSRVARPDIMATYDVIDPKMGDVVFYRRHEFSNESGEEFNRINKKDMKNYRS